MMEAARLTECIMIFTSSSHWVHYTSRGGKKQEQLRRDSIEKYRIN